MRSMTGFGRGRCEVGGRRLVVEIRSFNHRFLDLKIRLPWADPLVEQQLGLAIRKRLSRGAVTVTVRDDAVTAGPAAQVGVDLALARAYAAALSQIAEACGLAERPSLAVIAAQPGVLLTGGGAADAEALWNELAPGVDRALDELVAARGREGEALLADLEGRSQLLRRLAAEIARLAAEAPHEIRRRLEERLRRLLAGAEPVSPGAQPGIQPGLQIDPQRLAQEVALLADRADVAEEITRLNLHLDELDRLLRDDQPAGRRLDFLIQELHREVNTIGSKAQRAEIAARVVEAKSEVERLREQVQNVE